MQAARRLAGVERMRWMIRNDASEALRTKSAWEIARAAAILHVCSYNVVIRSADVVVLGMLRVVPGVAKLVMRPFFAHFCAGSSDSEAVRIRQGYNRMGIDCALDYAAEGEVGERHDDKTEWERNEAFRLKSIDASSTVTTDGGAVVDAGKKVADGFVAIKVTSLGDPDILQKITLESASKLTDSEVTQLKEIKQRLQNTIEYCASKSVHVLIDAEQSWVQPAIDGIATEMQRKYNVPGSSILVYQTYQCYLKDSLSRLERDMALAKSEGWNFAAKLVRGAYIKTEREHATKSGLPFPIHDSFEDTKASYEKCTQKMIEGMKTADWGLVLATHNPGSVEYALDLIGEDQKLKNRVRFATLKGMSDYIALSLALNNYRVLKLLPYVCFTS